MDKEQVPIPWSYAVSSENGNNVLFTVINPALTWLQKTTLGHASKDLQFKEADRRLKHLINAKVLEQMERDIETHNKAKADKAEANQFRKDAELGFDKEEVDIDADSDDVNMDTDPEDKDDDLVTLGVL